MTHYPSHDDDDDEDEYDAGPNVYAHTRSRLRSLSDHLQKLKVKWLLGVKSNSESQERMYGR